MNAPAMNAPADPAFAQRCRDSFGRQKAMALIGARLTLVEPGYVEIELPWRAELTQQKGFVHGGIVAKAQVVKPGRTLTVARAEVYADDGKHVATMLQTLMTLADTPDTP
jgi:acyl-coenzyme A thioesterase PaaI-like protein